MVRENSTIEAWKAAIAIQNEGAAREQRKIDEAVQKHKDTENKILTLKESRIQKERNHGKLLESCKDNALSKAIKAVYITALEANTLTDNGIFLAENMVESWIKEKGGASSIFRECANKTYFLSRLQQIVEDAAEEEVEDIEKDESKDDDSDNEKKEDSKEEKDTEDSKEDTKSEDKDEEEAEESEDDTEDSDETEKDTSDDPLNDTFDDVDDNTSDDEDIEDDDIEIVDDEESDEDTGLESDGVSHGKVFDELEKEEDVKKAIELIRQRVADAEETFIKRNAEDKKQIDELLSKISDNIKTVEDMDDEDSDESKIAQESASLARRKIKNITENRPLTIFEKMTRNLSNNIIKNSVVKEQFLDENGSVDFGSIVESAKVMYAFLETLNTLQLEKVDEAYIQKVLEEM